MRYSIVQLEKYTASDGYELAYRHWPATNPLSRVVFLHGIRSHGGWYLRTCDTLAQAGIEVFFLDRRGAGLNTKARGDTPSLRRMLDDIAEFLRNLPRDKPIHLAGISWGGKLAVGIPYRAPGLIDGLILIAPGLKSKLSPPLRTRLQILVNAMIRPTRLFPIPLNEPELFTSSPDGKEFIRQDPLGLTQATARFFVHSYGLEVYARKARKHLTMPVLLQLSGSDPIIDNAAVLRFANSWPTADLQVHEYPEAGHTLEFEGVQHPWRGDLLNWLTRQTGKV
jgi:alpha-beta hydrolase superfamily lysophospholipase